MHTRAAALHILCARPGLCRGGIAHPAHASYPLDTFGETQMRDILAEPAIVVVHGVRLMLPEHVGEVIATEMGRTRLVGAHLDTDAGANAATPILAELAARQADVQRGQTTALQAGVTHGDGATAELEREVAAVEFGAVTDPIAPAARFDQPIAATDPFPASGPDAVAVEHVAAASRRTPRK